MKPFGGGQLLNAKTSPFKQALTRTQCIQYALDRPAVLTVLPGVRGYEDLKDILTYLDASEEDGIIRRSAGSLLRTRTGSVYTVITASPVRWGSMLGW